MPLIKYQIVEYRSPYWDGDESPSTPESPYIRPTSVEAGGEWLRRSFDPRKAQARQGADRLKAVYHGAKELSRSEFTAREVQEVLSQGYGCHLDLKEVTSILSRLPFELVDRVRATEDGREYVDTYWRCRVSEER